MPSVTYTGNHQFQDAHEPVPSKSEWGMDMLTRTMRGSQVNLISFIDGLDQGDTFTHNGHPFYLQSWECDNERVYPSVSLVYKGLIGGIPPPKASGAMIQQSFTISANSVGSYATATREISYITRQSTTLYIDTGRPTSPTYYLDVNTDITILKSVIRAEGTNGTNYVFSGANAPSDLVSALTPAVIIQSFPECNPVVGSIYFECQDTAVKLFV